MSSWSYQTPPELSDKQYARWQTLLEERTGICFLQHKSILHKGLSQRMREVGIKDYERYFKQVSAVPGGVVEWAQLVDRISVKETSFFRDPLSFDVIKNFLLKRLNVNVRTQDYTLDIWSVGCSTGEEAYSLAMCASDLIDFVAANIFLGVIATDISSSALTIARRGCYVARKLADLPLALKHKYFVPLSEQEYEIVPSLRQRLCFVQGNLLSLGEAPRMAMDVIYCQNVLVYFRRDRKRQVLDSLVEHLKPGGMLMLGPGEAIGWQHPNIERTSDDLVQAYVKQYISN
ncbi:MAG: CheR family methyltransferase [Pseudomonadales bacterium]